MQDVKPYLTKRLDGQYEVAYLTPEEASSMARTGQYVRLVMPGETVDTPSGLVEGVTNPNEQKPEPLHAKVKRLEEQVKNQAATVPMTPAGEEELRRLRVEVEQLNLRNREQAKTIRDLNRPLWDIDPFLKVKAPKLPEYEVPMFITSNPPLRGSLLDAMRKLDNAIKNPEQKLQEQAKVIDGLRADKERLQDANHDLSRRLRNIEQSTSYQHVVALENETRRLQQENAGLRGMREASEADLKRARYTLDVVTKDLDASIKEKEALAVQNQDLRNSISVLKESHSEERIREVSRARDYWMQEAKDARQLFCDARKEMDLLRGAFRSMTKTLDNLRGTIK